MSFFFFNFFQFFLFLSNFAYLARRLRSIFFARWTTWSPPPSPFPGEATLFPKEDEEQEEEKEGVEGMTGGALLGRGMLSVKDACAQS